MEQKELELRTAIEDAIENYMKAGYKGFQYSRDSYDLGYEVRLTVYKVKPTVPKEE